MPRLNFFRRKSPGIFRKVIDLRRREFSYSQIREETGLAKSTIQNWLTHAGLTLTKEHLEIQSKNRATAHIIATAASKKTRARRKNDDIQNFVQKEKKYLNEPLFNYGIAIYESEGAKGTDCRFSNSDFRMIQAFVCFLEKYLFLNRGRNMSFNLYLHISREGDLERIKRFWSSKLKVPVDKIRVYWKRNIVVGRKDNKDYVGQLVVRVHGEKVLGSKLLAVSDIILSRYQRIDTAESSNGRTFGFGPKDF